MRTRGERYTIIDKEIRVTCKQIKYIYMYVQIFMHNYVS